MHTRKNGDNLFAEVVLRFFKEAGLFYKHPNFLSQMLCVSIKSSLVHIELVRLLTHKPTLTHQVGIWPSASIYLSIYIHTHIHTYHWMQHGLSRVLQTHGRGRSPNAFRSNLIGHLTEFRQVWLICLYGLLHKHHKTEVVEVFSGATCIFMDKRPFKPCPLSMSYHFARCPHTFQFWS
jgi:hypothetical protein